MLDQLLDLFDRDRRSRRTGSGHGGVKGLLARFTGEDDDRDRGHSDDPYGRDGQRRDDDARPGDRRGRRERFDLED